MKRILVDCALNQTRIALVENGELIEFICENKNDESIVGNIYCGRVKNVVKGMQAAFVDIGMEKNAYLFFDEKMDKALMPKLDQSIIVQVEKPATGAKGAVVTSKISFPGKFAVILPNDKNVGISRKITDSAERERIKEIVSSLLPENYGIIIRTEAFGKTKAEFEGEISSLIKKAEEVFQKGKFAKPPVVLNNEASADFKSVMEVFSFDVDECVVNDNDFYNGFLEFCSGYEELKDRIKLYNEAIPIFENFYVESQCEKMFNKWVWLKSGGFLVIEQTEALVSIDVNTGKFTGNKDLQKTILKTNLEAALEIAKQLRLRNLSGIIIVDFIDMKSNENKLLLKEELEKYVKHDRIKTVVVGMTELGLMQLTRKKVRPSVEMQTTVNCRSCNGSGRMVSADYVAGKIRREVENIFAATIFDEVTVSADKRLLNIFAGDKNEFVKKTEEKFKKRIILKNVSNTDYGFYEIERKKVN